MPSRLGLATRVVLAVLLLGSCATPRPIRERVFDDGTTTAFLRSEALGVEVVRRGFGHPVSIPAERMLHILSRIDLRRPGQRRETALPLTTTPSIAAAASSALGQAGPDQEIGVRSIRLQRRFGVFDRRFLTSLLLYVRGERLLVHLSHADWELPRRSSGGAARRPPGVRGAAELAETRPGQHPLSFELVAGPGMRVEGPQALAIDWRDEVFSRPSRARVGPGGELRPRTVLDEYPE